MSIKVTPSVIKDFYQLSAPNICQAIPNPNLFDVHAVCIRCGTVLEDVQYTSSLTCLSWLIDTDKTLCERLNLNPGDNANRPNPPAMVNFPTTAEEQLTYVGICLQATQYANITSETLNILIFEFLFARNKKKLPHQKIYQNIHGIEPHQVPGRCAWI